MSSGGCTIVVMILSDTAIREAIDAGQLTLDPIDLDRALQPTSVDVHLAASFRTFDSHRHRVIDPRRLPADLTTETTASTEDPFVLHPGEFALASTVETVGLHGPIVGRVEGKSSLGRCGLAIHATAGFIDAGFHGNITLELSNVANLPVLLYPGMPIAQFAFFAVQGKIARLYGHPDLRSKYQGQAGPTASAYHRNFNR